MNVTRSRILEIRKTSCNRIIRCFVNKYLRYLYCENITNVSFTFAFRFLAAPESSVQTFSQEDADPFVRWQAVIFRGASIGCRSINYYHTTVLYWFRMLAINSCEKNCKWTLNSNNLSEFISNHALRLHCDTNYYGRDPLPKPMKKNLSIFSNILIPLCTVNANLSEK